MRSFLGGNSYHGGRPGTTCGTSAVPASSSASAGFARRTNTEHRGDDVKLGRNDPCHCGSGQKYKKCHLPKDDAAHSAELLKVQAAAAAAAAEAAAAAGDDAEGDDADAVAAAAKKDLARQQAKNAAKPVAAPAAKVARRRGVA